jgi:hypothetical protein
LYFDIHIYVKFLTLTTTKNKNTLSQNKETGCFLLIDTHTYTS